MPSANGSSRRPVLVSLPHSLPSNPFLPGRLPRCVAAACHQGHRSELSEHRVPELAPLCGDSANADASSQTSAAAATAGGMSTADAARHIGGRRAGSQRRSAGLASCAWNAIHESDRAALQPAATSQAKPPPGAAEPPGVGAGTGPKQPQSRALGSKGRGGKRGRENAQVCGKRAGRLRCLERHGGRRPPGAARPRVSVQGAQVKDGSSAAKPASGGIPSASVTSSAMGKRNGPATTQERI